MQAIANQLRLQNKTIGFVPTMGFLHAGHLSLVNNSKQNTDITVVSIYVNPTQFSPTEDLSSYPRDFERDSALLNQAGVDYIFLPSDAMMYPHGYETFVSSEVLTRTLEGEKRPTHFRGVTTIVSKLFNIVKPHKAYFGQKDAQQASVLCKMVIDLNYDIEMNICPIVREEDGLALSSRNVYLSNNERKDALVLSKSLKMIEERVKSGVLKVDDLLSEGVKMYSSVSSASLDYLTIVDKLSFEQINMLEEGKEYFCLVACKIGKTRLIDNLLLKI